MTGGKTVQSTPTGLLPNEPFRVRARGPDPRSAQQGSGGGPAESAVVSAGGSPAGGMPGMPAQTCPAGGRGDFVKGEPGSGSLGRPCGRGSRRRGLLGRRPAPSGRRQESGRRGGQVERSRECQGTHRSAADGGEWRAGRLTGGWCGGRGPEGEDGPDGTSRCRAGPAPTGRERLGVCGTSNHARPPSRPKPDRFTSRPSYSIPDGPATWTRPADQPATACNSADHRATASSLPNGDGEVIHGRTLGRTDWPHGRNGRTGAPRRDNTANP